LRDAYFDHHHVTVIEPPKGWQMLDWRELWAYRELLWVFMARDVKVRYRQTVLGAAWAILRPVTTMIIFSVVFGRLAQMPSDGYPYPVFVYAGLLPWTFFAGGIAASGHSLIGASHLISKVYFPRMVIPLASAGSGLVDLLISTGILMLMMLWYGVGWSVNLLAAPFLLFAVVFTALGIGTLLSALTVEYRDFAHITPFLVQVWMYVTPVIFPVSLVPQKWQWLLYLNPMTGLVEGFRSAFLGKPFDLMGLAVSFAVAAVIFAIGIAYFQKVERRFADII
jgi:lipopolysaccharide transport system permease protein